MISQQQLMTLACYLYYNINIWVVIIIILFVNGVEYSNLEALCIFLHLHHLDILFTMLQYSNNFLIFEG